MLTLVGEAEQPVLTPSFVSPSAGRLNCAGATNAAFRGSSRHALAEFI